MIFAASGFSLLECLQQAIHLNEAFMRRVLARDPAALRLHLAFGNGAAFGIGSGVALCAAAVAAGPLGGGSLRMLVDRVRIAVVGARALV